MSDFSKEPPDPIGDADVAIWLRALKRWVKSFKLISIVGGTIKRDPGGGYHLVINSQPQPPTPPVGWNFAKPAIELPAAPYPAYPAQTVIHVQSTNALVTAGIVDAGNPTGPLVQSSPGFWVCRQAVPAQSAVGATPVWNLPQLPLPNPANIDDPKNFWVVYIPDAQCY